MATDVMAPLKQVRDCLKDHVRQVTMATDVMAPLKRLSGHADDRHRRRTVTMASKVMAPLKLLSVGENIHLERVSRVCRGHGSVEAG